jgi:hypothetical protein
MVEQFNQIIAERMSFITTLLLDRSHLFSEAYKNVVRTKISKKKIFFLKELKVLYSKTTVPLSLVSRGRQTYGHIQAA